MGYVHLRKVGMAAWRQDSVMRCIRSNRRNTQRWRTIPNRPRASFPPTTPPTAKSKQLPKSKNAVIDPNPAVTVAKSAILINWSASFWQEKMLAARSAYYNFQKTIMNFIWRTNIDVWTKWAPFLTEKQRNAWKWKTQFPFKDAWRNTKNRYPGCSL